MNCYEALIAEYEDEVTVEDYDMHDTDGFYCDGYALIKRNMLTSRKTCVFAEELGHHHTTVGDILDQKYNIYNQKQEHKARVWAYQKLLPIENVYYAAMQGYTETWQIAEYYDLDEEFVIDALKYYGILDI